MHFRRPPPTVADRLVIVALVEGDTEEQYINHWRRIHRAQVNINVGRDREAPLTMVRRAARIVRSERRLARRGRPSVDQVWCIFDCDEHAHISDALQMARDNGIMVGFSNPCLELWFLLHFQTQWAEIDRSAVQRRAYEHMHCPPKTVSDSAFEMLRDRTDDALRRASQLAERHRSADHAETHNPSSGLGVLIQTVRTL